MSELPVGHRGSIAEAADALTVLADQAERWRNELRTTQERLNSMADRSASESPEAAEFALLTPDRAVSVMAGLVGRGARKISYVRSAAEVLVDRVETREAILADPGICVRELVSRPAELPRAGTARGNTAVRVTWMELAEIVIIDASVAFVPSIGAERSAEVAMVRQPLLLGQLEHSFNAAWIQADTGREPLAAHYMTEAELKQRIVLLLADGAKDEAVARCLGISVRTCRRHIAAILDQLDSSSRFQAGFRAAMLGAAPAQRLAPRPRTAAERIGGGPGREAPTGPSRTVRGAGPVTATARGARPVG
jgi:DNA-binding CsgD family transcriptional regulator